LLKAGQVLHGKPPQNYGVSPKYGGTQFYLQSDISEPYNPSRWRLVLDLPTTEGWKA